MIQLGLDDNDMVFLVEEIYPMAAEWYEKAYKEARAVDQKSWEEFAQRALQGGASAAHKMSKEVQEPLEQVTGPDGELTTKLGHVVAWHRNKWA